MKLKIDQEFATLNPPLAHEEEAALLDSLKTEGCRDPIAVWKGTIIDGHNRHRLCAANKIDCPTREHNFASREEAIRWACTVQAGRRNATADHRAYLIGKIYRSEVAEHGGERPGSGPKPKDGYSSGNSYHLNSGEDAKAKTAEKIGDAHGVTEKTVRNNAEFAEAVDAIAAVAPEAKAAILAGDVSGSRKQIEKLAELPKRERKKAAQAIASGTPVAEAIAEATDEPAEVKEEKDANGVPIPDACLPLWGLRADLAQVHRWIGDCLGLLDGVAERSKDMIYLDATVSSLKNARQSINNAKPWAVCPYCTGSGKYHNRKCDACKTAGLVTRCVYQQAPSEMRA